MNSRKMITCIMAGVAAFVLALLIVYLYISEVLNEIVVTWLVGFNIVLIAGILVWRGLGLEKDDRNDKHGEGE